MSGSGSPIGKLLKGALAGFVATAPMFASMLVGWSLLPRREKYPLPPRLTTEELSERLGIEEQLAEKELKALSIFSHFGYGALFGALYALLESRVLLHSRVKGILTGLGV